MSDTRDLIRAIRDYSIDLRKSLDGDRGGDDYLDEPSPVPFDRHAARERVLRLTKGRVLIENAAAVFVMEQGQRRELGTCQRPGCRAYCFDAMLPFDRIAIDYAPRQPVETECKAAWCRERGLRYVGPGDLNNLHLPAR